MGTSTTPLNSNSVNSLKLVAAASLPKSQAVETKPGTSPTKKMQLNAPQLSDADLLEISKLKARDTQLRQHEQAHHAASAGVDVSSASFTYQRGPNGVNYAVSGDVRIDTTAPRDPEARLAQAAMIGDVALAPADPTPTDRAVAAKAQQMTQQARAEIAQQISSTQPQNITLPSNQGLSQDAQNPVPKRIDTFA